MRSHVVLSLVAVCSAFAFSAARADEGSGLRYQLSGFANFTVAKVLAGSEQSYMQWKCPCAIQNWEYVGVYEKSGAGRRTRSPWPACKALCTWANIYR